MGILSRLRSKKKKDEADAAAAEESNEPGAPKVSGSGRFHRASDYLVQKLMGSEDQSEAGETCSFCVAHVLLALALFV